MLVKELAASSTVLDGSPGTTVVSESRRCAPTHNFPVQESELDLHLFLHWVAHARPPAYQPGLERVLTIPEPNPSS
jgi:hypothetical protein